MRGCRAFKRPLAIAGFSRKKTVKEEFSGPKPRCRKEDRKSTRLNSSHSQISYAVFCLKKKKAQPECRVAYRLHLSVHSSVTAGSRPFVTSWRRDAHFACGEGARTSPTTSPHYPWIYF